jgi:hypothetical protein
MKDPALVEFREHGEVTVLDPSLLELVGGGGWSIEANYSHGRTSTNQNCPTSSYNNTNCVSPVNGNCGVATNEVCVYVPAG